MVLYFKSNVGEHFWRVFHPNISNICRQPKQESVRFAGAAVLSSSKGEYWKVHNDENDEEVDEGDDGEVDDEEVDDAEEDFEEVDEGDDGYVENDDEEEDH